jgi:mannose/fructose/N-acetylgalactosamine-specific phosphotransferase system component IID
MTTQTTASGGKVTRRDLIWSWVLWTFFSHSNYNYERLQATAFAHAMTPIIKRLYHTPEEISAALKRHLVFFNTEPNWGGVIHGAVIAMEEQRANGADIDDDAINSVKAGLMGPLAGIGDTIDQGTITPILLALGIGIAGIGTVTAGQTPDIGNITGNPLGAVVYIILASIVFLSIAYFAYTQGYYRGREFVTDILRSGALDRIITGASVLGNLVLGALAAQFVAVYVAYPLNVGNTHLNLQTDVLDKIFPGLLGLGLVLMTWWLLRRGLSPIRLLIIYLVIALVGAVPFNGPAPQYVTGSCGSSILQPYGPCTPPAAAK